MSEFCLRPDIVFALLDEVSRHRALAPHESEIMEEILAMEIDHFRWNPRLESQLLVAAASPGGIARFSRRFDIPPYAAYCKLHRLRKRKTRKADLTAVKG